jgi:hypothetical protein
MRWAGKLAIAFGTLAAVVEVLESRLSGDWWLALCRSAPRCRQASLDMPAQVVIAIDDGNSGDVTKNTKMRGDVWRS